MAKINYAEIKAAHDIMDVAERRLGLQVKSRSTDEVKLFCSECGGKDPCLSINPNWQPFARFKCFRSNDSGSVIDLVMHIRKCEPLDAIKWLEEESSPRPAAKRKPEPEKKTARGDKGDPAFNPSEYAEKLVYECPEVQALASYLTPEVARELCIGKATSGIHRGRVVSPVRDHTGRIVWFQSAGDWKLPPRASI